MNITRYKLVAETILNDDTIIQQSKSRDIFRFEQGHWWDNRNTRVTDAELEARLAETRQLARPWRPASRRLAYFPINDLDAVVFATFHSAPSESTRDIFAKRLGICLSGAYDRFAATHHPITGLLNRLAFNARLDEVTLQLGSSGQDDEQMVLESKGSPAICIVAIDIDHFKQVNDNYGHLYGDIVLQALAKRLERAARETAEKLAIQVIPAHPSGEEFLVMLYGIFSPEQERAVAETIRVGVSSRMLPDDQEWQEFTADAQSAGVTLPHEAERSVTISVGYASTRSVGNDSPEQLRLTLQNKADVALHRAKASGRDRTVGYDEIVSTYGRVLEHHRETNIVAIDIGRMSELE